jgi:hypothetical protein
MTKGNLLALSLVVLAISASTEATARTANSGLYSRVVSSAQTSVQRSSALSDLYGSPAAAARKPAQLYFPPPRPRPPCRDKTRPC